MSSFAFEHSAGGLLLDGERVLLIQTQNLKGQKVWSFPKGQVEAGEAPQDTALREVREETGYQAEILRPLGPVTYWFRRGEQRVKKRVDWFWMRPLQKTGEPDSEVLQVRWATLSEALGLLSYRSDRDLLHEIQTAPGNAPVMHPP